MMMRLSIRAFAISFLMSPAECAIPDNIDAIRKLNLQLLHRAIVRLLNHVISLFYKSKKRYMAIGGESTRSILINVIAQAKLQIRTKTIAKKTGVTAVQIKSFLTWKNDDGSTDEE
jgi:hypothetical protein